MRRAGGALRLAATIVAKRAEVAVLLARHPVDECLRRLTCAHPRTMSDADVARIGHWTEQLLRNRRSTRTTCLHRALVRYAMLSRAGRAPTFVMGLDPTRDLEGHAWVELDGAPWMEQSAPELTPTLRYPAPDA